jgi:hypothetical protein
MTIRKPLVGVVSIAAAVAALSACKYTPTADNNYHGSVAGTGAPSSTVSTPAVPAYPVTITGTGPSVQTADLVAHGYTVTYQASSNCLQVFPVQADGSDGAYVVNQCGHGDQPASGTTTFKATGRTTFRIANNSGPWTLTFNPL